MEADCVANGLHDNTDQTFIKSMKVDGGASQNNLLMQVSECSAVCFVMYQITRCFSFIVQFQSDLLEVPLHRPTVHETTALGAAFAAGLGVGFWPNIESIGQLWKQEKEWNPTMPENLRSGYVSISIYHPWT